MLALAFLLFSHAARAEGAAALPESMPAAPLQGLAPPGVHIDPETPAIIPMTLHLPAPASRAPVGRFSARISRIRASMAEPLREIRTPGGGEAAFGSGRKIDEALELAPASPSDAGDISRLVLESAPEFLPASFGPRIGSALGRLSTLPRNMFSHENVRIARSDGAVVGMLLGYTGRQKKRQELRTGLLLLKSLGASMIMRLPGLLELQKSIGDIPLDSYYISNVAVEPSARGRGIGQTLIDDAERSARASGASSLCLDVEADNPKAQRLYERLGFRVESASVEVSVGGRKFSLRRMVKPLRKSPAQGLR
jgi:ribosomal protein S18 acetylase RimI-like enzyme